MKKFILFIGFLFILISLGYSQIPQDREQRLPRGWFEGEKDGRSGYGEYEEYAQDRPQRFFRGWLEGEKRGWLDSDAYRESNQFRRRGRSLRGLRREENRVRRGFFRPWFLLPNITEEERRNLEKIREEDPEKFQEIVREKRYNLMQGLRRLRKEDPEEFKKRMREYRERQIEFLAKLKKENPRLFRRIVERRREYLRRKLEYLRRINPDKYERIMKRLRGRGGYNRGWQRGWLKGKHKGWGEDKDSSIQGHNF